jgi:parvulin-like peptidyl-prolyl isomerase
MNETAANGAFFMRKLPVLILLVVALGLLAAACGGGDDEESVPSDAVAVVGENEISKAEFDALLAQAKAGYKAQQREFPKAGTPEYNSLKNSAVQYLVQQAQLAQRAEELDVQVTDEQVDERLSEIKKQYFGGSERRYQNQLKEQGMTDARVRKDVRSQLIQEAIFKEVTDGVKVTDKDIEDYYKNNASQYGQPESREVRHILVSSKKQADELYRRLRGGESFAKLAKQYSKDPGSKDQGGRLTVARGQTVPAFDRTAFTLKTGTVSQPVRTQYGYHLIEPLSAVKPAKTTPLKDVRDSIRQQLLQQKRNKTMTDWVEKMKKDLSDETSYQVGFAPPRQSGTGTTSTTG